MKKRETEVEEVLWPRLINVLSGFRELRELEIETQRIKTLIKSRGRRHNFLFPNPHKT